MTLSARASWPALVQAPHVDIGVGCLPARIPAHVDAYFRTDCLQRDNKPTRTRTRDGRIDATSPALRLRTAAGIMNLIIRTASPAPRCTQHAPRTISSGAVLFVARYRPTWIKIDARRAALFRFISVNYSTTVATYTPLQRIEDTDYHRRVFFEILNLRILEFFPLGDGHRMCHRQDE